MYKDYHSFTTDSGNTYWVAKYLPGKKETVEVTMEKKVGDKEDKEEAASPDGKEVANG